MIPYLGALKVIQEYHESSNNTPNNISKTFGFDK